MRQRTTHPQKPNSYQSFAVSLVIGRLGHIARTVKPKRYRYQIQFACFDCRKSFKRPYTVGEQERSAWLSRRISGRQPTKPFNALVFHCPDCNAEATLMGRAFRAPRYDDVTRWRAVE